MATNLRDLLFLYREQSKSEREKGGYFERLVRIWLEHAPTQKDQFTQVLTWADFARARGLKETDTGIDLVAQIAGEDDAWCAVQCKFYAPDYRIQKSDLDSFFTASGKKPFTRRLIVDSTNSEWGVNAREAIHDQTIPVTRIGLNEIEYSGIDWDLFARTEVVEPWPVTLREGDLAFTRIDDPVAFWRVEQMKFGGKRPNQDRTVIHDNPRLTIENIPLRAYDYVVNGKSAIDWVMERQRIKTDPASGIISDANAYATKTIGNPRYPFDLLCRVITVSMGALDVVEGLPAFDVMEG